MDVFGTGIVAGALCMGTFAVHPAAAKLDAPAHVLLRQELIRRLSWYMPPLMLLPVVTSVAAMTLCPMSVMWMLNALGLALSLATVGITVALNAPLNRRFARWPAEAVPRDWQRYIHRWNMANAARTTTALAAFACAVLSGS